MYICLCIYSDATLKGYQYCSGMSSVLKRTDENKYFNFTTAKAVCQGQGGQLLTPTAYNSGCTSELLSGSRQAWIDVISLRPSGNDAQTTQIGGERSLASSVKEQLHAVCEFRNLSTVCIRKGFLYQIWTGLQSLGHCSASSEPSVGNLTAFSFPGEKCCYNNIMIKSI